MKGLYILDETLMTQPQAATQAGEAATAWRRIADEIEAAIGRGDYEEGATLPSSLALAERYGVHRHTVRQAFRHLAERGLVSVSRGRGTQVTAPRFPYRIGRRVSMRTNFGKAGIAVAGSILGAEIVKGEAEACASLRVDEGAALWRIETLSLAGGVPVSTGVHLLSAVRFPDFDMVLGKAGSSITAAFAACGIADYVRLSTRLSARLASEREALLLRVEPGAAVMVSSAIDALPDLTPIHLIAGVFAGERMEMVVEPFAE